MMMQAATLAIVIVAIGIAIGWCARGYQVTAARRRADLYREQCSRLIDRDRAHRIAAANATIGLRSVS